ncbi:MAG: DUF2905 domain-containing protein [Bacteroidia bacterium]|nr:DUF2905 domain-containing protein [Bacteroidia bacterium]
MANLGKVMMLLGGIVFLLGLLFFILKDKTPSFGNLPGDFSFQSGHTKIYFPMMSSILLSILLSLFFWLINKWK